MLKNLYDVIFPHWEVRYEWSLAILCRNSCGLRWYSQPQNRGKNFNMADVCVCKMEIVILRLWIELSILTIFGVLIKIDILKKVRPQFETRSTSLCRTCLFALLSLLLICHTSPKVRSHVPNFTFIWAEMSGYSPQNCQNFEFWP